MRFTTRSGSLYAIVLGEPAGTMEIVSLAAGNPHEHRRISQVRLLGHRGTMEFRQAGRALVIDVPAKLPSRHASVFKISFA